MFKFISRFLSFLWLFCIVFAFVMFAVENKEKVNLSLYPIPYQLEIARYALILVAFGVGYIFAIYHGMVMLRRQKSVTREFKTKANSLENELKKLKAQPAK